MEKSLTFTVDKDGIALVIIDVPGRPMNVLTPEFIDELSQVIDALVADAAIKGAILTSGKSSAFIAGADIKDMVGAYDRGESAKQCMEFSATINKVFRHLETCGKPIACAINGLALGVLFCAYITPIQNFVEWATGTSVFNADVYMLSHIPAKIDWREVGGIVLASAAMSILATLPPALRASRLDPVEALRYE